MYCLSPPMRGVPSGDWLCPLCGGHGPATLGDLDLTYRQLERRSNEAERTLMRFSSRRPAVEAETPTEEHARRATGDGGWSGRRWLARDAHVGAWVAEKRGIGHFPRE